MEENSEEDSIGASSIDYTEEESGGSSSENETERVAGNKRLKLKGKVDRISDLPDSLIHHILSFLPSTKEAIRTGILSKRWENQWTRVPVLIFYSTGKNDENFSQFIDRTLALHDCSKLKKFHVQYDYNKLKSDPHLRSKIRFATRKYVEELILDLSPQDGYGEIPYVLPKFLYNNDSLVKLELFKCDFISYRKPNWSINWSRLKELKLDCSSFSNNTCLVIEKVLFGSPVLELLELTRCGDFYKVVIASKSLKKLIFVDSDSDFDDEFGPKSESDQLTISCPNLEELSVLHSKDAEFGWSDLPGKTIENVLSASLLLHTLVLPVFGCMGRLVIASKSLRKLVLGEIYRASDFEISCPGLQELNLYQFYANPTCCPELKDFDLSSWERCLGLKMLGQFQHVNLLEIGSWFIEILSALEVEGESSPLLNCKCLTLHSTDFDRQLLGIVRAIFSSPKLEKLVIKLQHDQPGKHASLWYASLWYVKDCRRKNYCNADGTLFNCSVSNLKTVKIVGLSKRDVKDKLVFNFIEFLLKNAKVLEKVVVVLADRGTGFVFEVSTKLLSFQRSFPHTTIEFFCSK